MFVLHLQQAIGDGRELSSGGENRYGRTVLSPSVSANF